MPTYIEYPATLPCPIAAPIRSVERRVLTPQESGPFAARAFQRDRLAVQDITFVTLTAAQALIFDDWWRDTLIFGGAWFAADWPVPQGEVVLARRFIEPPRWEFLGLGLWRVQARFEVRGRGELPVEPSLIFLLHFEADLTDEAGGFWEAPDIIVDGLPNQFEIDIVTPMFGSGSGLFLSPNNANHVNSAPYTGINLGLNFQLEGFVRPRAGASQGGIIFSSGSFQGPNGVEIGPDPSSGQLDVMLHTSGELLVRYATALGSDEIARLDILTPTLIPIDDVTITHWAVASDAYSTRLYVDGVLANEDIGARPHPVERDAQHRFFIGAPYTGGIPPLQSFSSNRLGAWVDEMRLMREVSYTGSTITVPTPPLLTRL